MLYAPPEAYEHWRVNRRPGTEPFSHRGQRWFPLSSVDGFASEFNAAEQRTMLTFSPQAFAATRLTQEAAVRPALTPSIPSAFVNYDLSYTSTAIRYGNSTHDAGGLFEFGTSGNWGLLTSSHVARNYMASSRARGEFARLETTYQLDLPERNISLRVGDSATRGLGWNRSVYFGGIQVGRNFSLTPGFVTQPIPVLTGVSTAPSTVDLYINDALRQTSRVQPGPFAIDNFPLLTGSGQARIVVRDVLGRETVLIQDFFSHASLLEEGLTDWSLEAGAVREGLGTTESSYGGRFASGMWRQGLNKGLTLEGKLETSRKTRGLGLGVVAALPFQVLGQFGAATSQDDEAGAGHLWQLSLAQTLTGEGFTFDAQAASTGYRQVGQGNGFGFRRQYSLGYNHNLGSAGALGIGFATILGRDDSRINTFSANYTIPLPAAASLTLSLVHVKDRAGRTAVGGSAGSENTVGLSLFVPLERNLNSSHSLTRRGTTWEGYSSAARAIPNEGGWGWRALGGYRGEEAVAEGGLQLQTTRTLSTVDVSVSRSRQAMRAGLQGGMAWVDGSAYFSRRFDGSFAVVEVPGFRNLGIGLYGSIADRTDDEGKAVVTRLQPYQRNSVRLNPSELPISAEIDNIEAIVVPSARTAVKIVFPVRTGRGALLRVVFGDGEPAPAGAEIGIAGDTETFYVARRGEAFVTGLKDGPTRLVLRWKSAQCTLDISLPPGTPDDIPRIGPYLCKDVPR